MGTIYYYHYHPTEDGKDLEYFSPAPIPYDYGKCNRFSDRIYHSRNQNARFYVVTFGYEKSWQTPISPTQRVVDRYTIHFVFDGKGYINDKLVHAGQIFVVPPNEPYTIKQPATTPMTLGWIGLSGKELELMTEILHLPKQRIMEIQSSRMEQVESIFLDTVYGNHADKDIPYFLFSQFFKVLSIADFPYSNPSTIVSLYVNEAEKFINTHYMEPITVADVAKIANVSESHLRALYAQELGISPQKSIMNKRIAAAKALLEKQELPIWEIGEKTGYGNQSAFTKRFKLETGITPLEYRNSKK